MAICRAWVLGRSCLTAHEACRLPCVHEAVRVSPSRFLREKGMNNRAPRALPLPHHRLVAYQVAIELLALVRDAKLRDAKLRDQAMRAAKSVCLNVAEASGRTSPADKARVFGIARGEALEVAAALEIAQVVGEVDGEVAERGMRVAARLYAVLTGLAR